MRQRLVSLLTVLGAVTVLVLAANTVAIAAGGKGFLLGKANTAAKVTKLTRTTAGPALELKTKKATNAPLSVNGRGVVKNLNADLVDGVDAAQLARKTDVATVSGDVATVSGDVAELTSQASALAAMTPIANGFVYADASTLTSSSTGVSGVTWDAANARYLVTLSGINYFYSDFNTSVTPQCSGTRYSVGSIGGKVIVKFENSAGTGVQCAFTFSTTRLY